MNDLSMEQITQWARTVKPGEYRVGTPIPRELVEMARLAFEAGQGQLTRAVGDGGPAFPVRAASGMSLRDWFAAHASEQDMEAHSRTEVQRHVGTSLQIDYTSDINGASVVTGMLQVQVEDLSTPADRDARMLRSRITVRRK